MKIILAYLLHWANSAPPRHRGLRVVFYRAKDIILARYGKEDGFDLQVIEHTCWDCDGDGCDRCNGTGVYRTVYVKLAVTRFGPFKFHSPDESAIDDCPLVWRIKSNSTMTGIVKHKSHKRLAPIATAIIFVYLGWRQPKRLPIALWRLLAPQSIQGLESRVKFLSLRLKRTLFRPRYTDVPF